MIAMLLSVGLFIYIGVTFNFNGIYWVLLLLYTISRSIGVVLNSGHHVAVEKEVSAVLKNTDDVLKADKNLIKISGDIIELNEQLLAQVKKSLTEDKNRD